MNTFFQSQTVLNEQNAIDPNLPVNSHVDSIVFTRIEIESVLKSLVVDKASGPNGLSNRILRELSFELSIFFAPFSISPHDQAQFLHSIKKQMFVLFQRRVTCPSSLIIDQYPYSILRAKLLRDSFFKHLYNHLQDKNLLSSLQSSFIP